MTMVVMMMAMVIMMVMNKRDYWNYSGLYLSIDPE